MESNNVNSEVFMKIALVTVCAMIFPMFAWGWLAGDLDASFNGNGLISQENVTSVAQQKDGKLVAAGCSGKYFLMRYNIDGSLDSSFSGDGKVEESISGWSGCLKHVAIQDDGKIVALGNAKTYETVVTYGGLTQFVNKIELLRFNADGNLDVSFSGDGRTSLLENSDQSGAGFVLQSDKKISVALTSKYFYMNGDQDSYIGVARFDSDGSIDQTFSDDGYVKFFVEGYESSAGSIALQDNGKLIICGEAYVAGNSGEDFAVVRLNANGVMDNSFDKNGMLLTSVKSNTSEKCKAIIQQKDGKILIGGSSYMDKSSFSIVRYNQDGEIDDYFGFGGKVVTSFGFVSDEAYSLIQQDDGKLVLSGLVYDGNNYRVGVVRYNLAGSLGAC